MEKEKLYHNCFPFRMLKGKNTFLVLALLVLSISHVIEHPYDDTAETLKNLLKGMPQSILNELDGYNIDDYNVDWPTING